MLKDYAEKYLSVYPFSEAVADSYAYALDFLSDYFVFPSEAAARSYIKANPKGRFFHLNHGFELFDDNVVLLFDSKYFVLPKPAKYKFISLQKANKF